MKGIFGARRANYDHAPWCSPPRGWWTPRRSACSEPRVLPRGPDLWMSQYAACGAQVLCCWTAKRVLGFGQAATNRRGSWGRKTANSPVLAKGGQERSPHLSGSITKSAWMLSVSLKNVFLSVCSGCLGFFLQFLAASLASDSGSSLSCDVSDALKVGKISSCLPCLQDFTPSVGYLLKRRWAIP